MLKCYDSVTDRVGTQPDIRTDNNRLTLDRTKEQLQQTAAFQLENPNTGAGTSTSPTTGGQLGR